MHCASVFPLQSGPTIYTVYMLYRFVVIACGINCVNKAIESTFLTYNSQFSYSSISLFCTPLPTLSPLLISLSSSSSPLKCCRVSLVSSPQTTLNMSCTNATCIEPENWVKILFHFPFPLSAPSPLLILESTIFCPYLNCFHD